MTTSHNGNMSDSSSEVALASINSDYIYNSDDNDDNQHENQRVDQHTHELQLELQLESSAATARTRPSIFDFDLIDEASGEVDR